MSESSLIADHPLQHVIQLTRVFEQTSIVANKPTMARKVLGKDDASIAHRHLRGDGLAERLQKTIRSSEHIAQFIL